MNKLQILEKEQMDSIKELSDIQLNIGKGKAVLSELKETIASYLVRREKDAQKRIQKVLEASRDALLQIGTFREDLASYKRQIEGYYKSVKEFFTKMETLKETLDEANEDFDIRTESIYADIDALKTEIKTEKAFIVEARSNLDKEQIHIIRENKLLTDRRETLKRGFDELKRKQK